MEENLLDSLTILWKGMLAIFIVIGIIAAVTIGLRWWDKKAELKKSAAVRAAEAKVDEGGTEQNKK